jgi:uncharacterized protein (DUF302 family)
MIPEWDYYRRVVIDLALNRTVAKLTRALREANFVVGGAMDLQQLAGRPAAERAVVLHVYDPAVVAAALDDDADLAVFTACLVAIRELDSRRSIVTVAEPLGVLSDDPEWKSEHLTLGAVAARAERRLGDVLAAIEHSALVAA